MRPLQQARARLLFGKTRNLYCVTRRYGLGEGFTNIAKSKVHHAAMKIQQRIAISLHENVPDFEEDLGGMS